MKELKQTIRLARERAAVLSGDPDASVDVIVSGNRCRQNIDAVAVATALLERFADVEPFICEVVEAPVFDLATHWDMDPAPLFSLNSAVDVQKGVRDIFGADVSVFTVDCEKALDYLRDINARRYLGKSTAAKMAYLKPITGRAFKHTDTEALRPHFAEVITATIELLKRQARRLRRQTAACTHIDRLVLSLADLLVRYRLKARFDGHRLFAGRPDLFYRVYADEIAQSLADHFYHPCFAQADILEGFRFLKKEGVEVAFARRDKAFLHSGDYYGDCTASEVRSQVDPEIANIHWTVYAWLLDPYYRIIDVYFNGRRVLKGHVMPLIIHNRRVLMLDAIETIPSIRDTLRGKENLNISRSVYDRRQDLLQALFDAVKDLAGRMGVDAVYVDKYSNTKWVRAAVSRLPADSYHIDDVVKPFGNGLIAAVVERFLGRPANGIVEEIQARNIGLMDQQLRPNYKEVGVLAGRRKDYFIAVRGI